MSRVRRRWPWIVGGAVAALVVAVGAVGLVAYRGRSAKDVSVEEAVQRARTSTTEGGPALGRPAQGVYQFTGGGTGKLSLQSASQEIGPTLPATVTWQGNDCWVFRIDYNSNHWQSWTYCQDGNEMVDRGGQVFQRFDFVVIAPESLSSSTCDPPAVTVRPNMTTGDNWQQKCTITTPSTGDTTMNGPLTFVGDEAVGVGSTDVNTQHFSASRTYEGAQTGSSKIDTWYATDTGLPVRSVWKLTIHSPSPIGDVTYNEDGNWQAQGLTPKS